MNVNQPTSPPVVFVSQRGTGGASWHPVLDRLTCGSTTVTYDRPGTGACQPRPAPNPPLPYSAFADELAAVLDERGITEPVVLVGHSVGSLIVRLFADRHPGRVAGVVHVDGSIPRLRFGPGLEPEGLGPPADGDGPDATLFDLPDGEAEVVQAVAPSVPAVVIACTPGLWEPEWPAAGDRLWTAYQRQLARHLGAPLVIAANAGHQIPDEAPALVAYVIDRVVEAASAEGPVVLGEATLTKAGGGLDG